MVSQQMGWLILWWISVSCFNCQDVEGRRAELSFFCCWTMWRLHICVFVLLKFHCGPSNGPHQLSRVVNHVRPGWTSWSRTRRCRHVREDVFWLRGDLETCKSSSVERRGWKSLGVWQIYLCFIIPQKSKLLQRELLVSIVHKLSQFTDSRALWERWQMLC